MPTRVNTEFMVCDAWTLAEIWLWLSCPPHFSRAGVARKALFAEHAWVGCPVLKTWAYAFVSEISAAHAQSQRGSSLRRRLPQVWAPCYAGQRDFVVHLLRRGGRLQRARRKG